MFAPMRPSPIIPSCIYFLRTIAPCRPCARDATMPPEGLAFPRITPLSQPIQLPSVTLSLGRPPLLRLGALVVQRPSHRLAALLDPSVSLCHCLSSLQAVNA